jgi:hypothetical protein
MIKRIILAGLMAGGVSTAAMAQEVLGDWVGTVKTPGAELTITVHVEPGPGGTLQGVAGSPDQTPTPLPMSDIVMKDGTLSFDVPMVGGSFKGTWDATGKRWNGAMTQQGFEMPMFLGHGKVGARPTVAGLDGDWQGVLQVPQGDLRIVLKVKTDANGTLAMFSSPDQSPGEMAAAVTHVGDAVSFQMKGMGGFDGKMSADGKILDGYWRQGGSSIPLTMKKGG